MIRYADLHSQLSATIDEYLVLRWAQVAFNRLKSREYYALNDLLYEELDNEQ